jgi:hypothetical protein
LVFRRPKENTASGALQAMVQAARKQNRNSLVEVQQYGISALANQNGVRSGQLISQG